MDTQKLEFEIPSYIMEAIHKSGDDLVRHMKILTAINLYLSEELSLEMAAEFAGRSKREFETLLSKNQLPVSLIDYDDYQRDLEVISNL